MRVLLLSILLLPFSMVAQIKYNSEAKKLYNKGIKELKDGNETAALDFFAKCVDKDKRYAEAYLNMSAIYLGQEKHDKALNSAKNAYSQNKFQPAVYSQLGKCYFENMMYDSATFFLNKGLLMGDNSASNFIYLGRSHYENENFEASLEIFDKAIQMDNSNAGIYNARGKTKFQLADYGGAEADFTRAQELNPDTPRLLLNLANCSVAQEKYESAQNQINNGINKVSEADRLQLLILQGNLYLKQDSLSLAVETFEEALKLDQSNATILNNQAAVLLEMEDYESAITKCNKALEIQGEMMEAYFNRGIANEMLRNIEDACADWEQAFILGSEKAEEFLNSATCNE